MGGGIFLLKVQGWDPSSEAPPPKVNPQADPEPQEEGEGEGESMQGEIQDPTERQDTRLVLVTDLGMLVKRAVDGTQDVFVQSIAGGEPVAGAMVEVLGKNGLSALLPQDRRCHGPRALPEAARARRANAQPMLYLVRKGERHVASCPCNRSDRALDFSRFDVGGVRNAARAPAGSPPTCSPTAASIGPATRFRVGMIVKRADWATPSAGVPLEAEITDPRGLVVQAREAQARRGAASRSSRTRTPRPRRPAPTP